MHQSVLIILQCINRLPRGPFKIEDSKITSPFRAQAITSMEAVISHFKLYCDGFVLKNANVYIGTETPKGEFGVFLVTDNSPRPYRCKIRSPCFFSLQTVDFLAYRLMLGDLVAVLGSIDIVLGEIDR